MKHSHATLAGALLLAGCGQHVQQPIATSPKAESVQSAEWPVYGGSLAGDRYSELRQINQENVRQLQIAWRYDAGPDRKSVV